MSDFNIVPIEWLPIDFDDCFITINPTFKIKQAEYLKSGKIAIVDQGKELVGGYSNDFKLQVNVELPVIVFGDHTRIFKYVNFSFIAGADGIKVIKPIKPLSEKFYYYFFSYVLKEIPNKGYARHFQHLKKIGYFLPPLNEQHRIVSKIEELFSELDYGVANLQLAQNQLKVYRQALLKHAFEGKLTEQWRKENNTEPAEKLLEFIKEERQQRYEQELKDWKAAAKAWEKDGKKGRKLGKPKKPIEVEKLNPEIFQSKTELPKSWLYNFLIAVIEEPKYGTSKKCTYNKSGTAVLRIPNLKSGIIDEEDLKYASFTEDEKEPYLLKENDILTVRSNGSIDLVGRCSIIRKINTDKLYAGYLIRLRPLSNIIDSRYLLYILESQNLRIQIELKAKSTSGVNNINSGELSSLIIPLCSKNEQVRITDELESQFSVIDNLERSIESSLQKSEALRQSILKKAFEGKLVPQNPNDEPSSKLLKWIQAEKKKYLEEQKELKKKSPKRIKKMSKELSIEEVLKTSDKPMLAKDVWQKSKHKDNIEDFYKELKDIQENIKEVKKGTESLLSLVK
jgi:type I restriction enzyme S subunit